MEARVHAWVNNKKSSSRVQAVERMAIESGSTFAVAGYTSHDASKRPFRFLSGNASEMGTRNLDKCETGEVRRSIIGGSDRPSHSIIPSMMSTTSLRE